MVATTPATYPLEHSLLAPGAQVVARDEEWVIRARGATELMGLKINLVDARPVELLKVIRSSHAHSVQAEAKRRL